MKNISYTSDGDADPVRLWRFDGGVGCRRHTRLNTITMKKLEKEVIEILIQTTLQTEFAHFGLAGNGGHA